ncbi:class I SAM-dependent methyltransferase [Methanosarcina sp. KYL-1]|uniref:class I SAM-dependent methyltransferase n=1 Tax=Methanosarcina sp. KYL-1 TaxID=2602068 RepID=UPI002100A74A|nr:class I SAM-dependent methyltransferase [Methanosarcina sp. KYL-1]MCQ1536388.1 class I SAM-dependent methyltransferase [Methanosarcina sp. KYL-1]
MSESAWKEIAGKNIPSSLELYPILYDYLESGCRVLDIGCGFGKISFQLASRGYAVTGVDLNEEGIEIAEDAAKSLNPAGRPGFRVGDASELPFPEGEFDAAIMQAFLTTIVGNEKRRRVMREACRILKPGGWLYLAEFGQNWHIELYRERYLKDFPVTKEEGSFLARNPDTGEVEFTAHHFSEKELVFLLVENGFELDYFKVEEFSTRTGNRVNGFVILAKKV